jgi:hypothetical protein
MANHGFLQYIASLEDVTQQENVLLISGKALERETNKTFLHRRHRPTGL